MSSSGHVSLSLIMKFGRRTGLKFWGSFNNSMSRGIGRMLWPGVDEYRNVCRDSHFMFLLSWVIISLIVAVGGIALMILMSPSGSVFHW